MTRHEPRVGGPCAAGVIFALAIEADAFARRVSECTEVTAGGLVFREGTVQGRRIAWCVGGVGRERARKATRLLIDGHRPKAIISSGFAGGLDPGLARGTVVQPSAVCGLTDDAVQQLAGQGGPLLVTADAIVRTTAEKQSLAEMTGAALVDMETLAVAEVAAMGGLPCHGLRVVSDAAGDELPADLGRLIEPRSAARKVGTVLRMLGRRPRAAIDLWGLWERAVVDGRTLATALEQLIGGLPSPTAPAAPSEGRA